MDELQKASERFDLPSVNSSKTTQQPDTTKQEEQEAGTEEYNSPLFGPHGVTQSSPISEKGDKSPLFFDSDPFHPSTNTEYSSEPVQGDPAWLSEFDSEFIDSLRGCVNFVD